MNVVLPTVLIFLQHFIFDHVSGSDRARGIPGLRSVAAPLDDLTIVIQYGLLVLVSELLQFGGQDGLLHPVRVREPVVDLGVDPEGEQQPHDRRAARYRLQNNLPMSSCHGVGEILVPLGGVEDDAAHDGVGE